MYFEHDEYRYLPTFKDSSLQYILDMFYTLFTSDRLKDSVWLLQPERYFMLKVSKLGKFALHVVIFHIAKKVLRYIVKYYSDIQHTVQIVDRYELSPPEV